MIVCTGAKTTYIAHNHGHACGCCGERDGDCDETADLDAAAEKIRASCFDNATSCSSENSAVVVDAVYDDFIAALARGGAFYADEAALISNCGPMDI